MSRVIERPTTPRSAPNRARHKFSLRTDRKSTRLNSSHDQISYAVFCLKKKKKHEQDTPQQTEKQATDAITSHIRHVDGTPTPRQRVEPRSHDTLSGQPVKTVADDTERH